MFDITTELSSNIFAILILAATIFALFLGILVYLKDPQKKLNQIFGLFGIVTAVWNFTNFMCSIQPDVFWIRAAYGIGVMEPTLGVFWILVLCKKNLTKTKVLAFMVPSLFFLYASLSGKLIIEEATKILPGGSIGEGKMGILMPYYSVYLVLMTIIMVYTLWSSYLRENGDSKKQILYPLLGVGIWSSLTAVFSFILPVFGITIFTSLDSVTVIIFLALTALGIARSRLFGVKVILTEMLVGIMGIVLLIVPFFMPSTVLKILMAMIFVFFVFIGYILIQYSRKEERMKEMLEQKVDKNTEELQLSKEELEKFYKVTIGREVRMAELKKKIEELEDK
ncbi:MAG: hypothetical protein WC926_04665 [Candidatus Paceibacterota bacterium]|jgi:hypothetical protein